MLKYLLFLLLYTEIRVKVITVEEKCKHIDAEIACRDLGICINLSSPPSLLVSRKIQVHTPHTINFS